MFSFINSYEFKCKPTNIATVAENWAWDNFDAVTNILSLDILTF